MTHRGTEELRTERLKLRRFREGDGEQMFKNWASDDEVTKYLTWPTHKSAEASEQYAMYLAEKYSDEKTYDWGIELKETGELIGSISCVGMDEVTESMALGWALSRKYWGRGIMPEAAKEVLRFFFEDVNAGRVHASHDSNNPKSGRVMAKIGMRHEGTQLKAGKNNSGICDVELYAILKTEWESDRFATNVRKDYMTNSYPVLEFDPVSKPKLDPEMLKGDGFDCDKMVITFFPEVVKKLLDEGRIADYLTISGENQVHIYRFTDDSEVMITLGQVGCPACAGNLDLFAAMGAKKVMFCGGGGVLSSDIDVGALLLVDGAIRDEGFSYQYVKPSRIIHNDAAINDKIAEYLSKNEVPYLRGLVWTTDALFRETEKRISLRKAEGAKIVEMEQAGCLAVASCRGIAYGALIYGGDDVSGDEWDNRSWRSREGIRYDLTMLCKRLTEIL